MKERMATYNASEVQREPLWEFLGTGLQKKKFQQQKVMLRHRQPTAFFALIKGN